jgi:hypothetical protein
MHSTAERVCFCFVFFGFKSNADRGLKGLCRTKKTQILSPWTKPPFEAPSFTFPPIRRTQGKRRRKEKKRKARTKTSPAFASGALMASSSLHYFVPSEKREVERDPRAVPYSYRRCFFCTLALCVISLRSSHLVFRPLAAPIFT